jgi:hypothetical protein
MLSILPKEESHLITFVWRRLAPVISLPGLMKKGYIQQFPVFRRQHVDGFLGRRRADEDGITAAVEALAQIDLPSTL